MSISSEDKINNYYWGSVVDVDDPKKLGRIRVRVEAVYGNIKTEHIPWAYPRLQHTEEFIIPELGAVVQIVFENNDIYFPLWYRVRGTEVDLNNDDYSSAVILLDRDLEKFKLDGRVLVRYTESEGIEINLTKSDNSSKILLRPDNSILLQNGQSTYSVHITEENISIGSENSSAEPAVLGQTNNDALDKINENIKEIADVISSNLQKLKSSALGSPYTAHLVSSLIAFDAELKTTESRLFEANKQFFPKTKSKIVTLD